MGLDKGISDSGINRWSFNSEVATVFDSHVRKSVPYYDIFHNTIANISDWFLSDGSKVLDIGTSSGELIKNLAKRHTNKVINYIGVDTSKYMCEVAMKNLSHLNNVIIHNKNALEVVSDINECSMITSILTLQFIPYKDRLGLIKNIYSALDKGGAFIVVEKVLSEDSNIDKMFLDLYHDYKFDQGLNESEIFHKARAIRGVMSPTTYNDNLDMLYKCGFNKVDVFFKWCNFVGYIAIK